MAKHAILCPLRKDPKTGSVTRVPFDSKVFRSGTKCPKGCKSVPYETAKKLISSGNFELVGEFDDSVSQPSNKKAWTEKAV